jgi:hypothetical protein
MKTTESTTAREETYEEWAERNKKPEGSRVSEGSLYYASLRIALTARRKMQANTPKNTEK